MPNDIDQLRQDLEGIDLREVGRSILRRSVTLIGGAATDKFMRRTGKNTSGPNQQTGIGALRIRSGRLARSLTGAMSAQASAGSSRGAPEGIFDLTPLNNGIRLTYGSKVPYARVHERGFSGTVRVPQHKRTMRSGFGPADNYPMDVTVRAHSRAMNMPKRPYLEPALKDQIDEIESFAQDELFDAIAGGGDS